jgi:hypothetical protein
MSDFLARRMAGKFDARNAVYRNGVRVGVVIPIGRRWLAYDLRGYKLGEFASKLEAYARCLRGAAA